MFGSIKKKNRSMKTDDVPRISRLDVSDLDDLENLKDKNKESKETEVDRPRILR